MEDKQSLFPVRPSEPLESECCGTGCSPCVFDIYKKQLTKWEEECERIRENKVGAGETEKRSSDSLNPENFLPFLILDIQPDAPSTFIFKFSSTPVTQDSCSGASIKIGQHVVIKIGNLAKQYTVLSIGSTEAGTRYFEIIIKIYPKGELTPLIGKLNVGDTVLMRGPFGKIIQLQRNEFKWLLMFAAGTGIAPMYRIIEQILKDDDESTRIKLIYCNRSVQTVLLKDRLREWSSFWNFEVIHYLSRNGGLEVSYGMSAKLKRFTYMDFIECSSKLDNPMILVCGTKSFEKDIINYISRSKIASTAIHVF